MFKQLISKNTLKSYLTIQQELWSLHYSVKFHSTTSSQRKQLGGYVYKEDTTGFKSKWRIPFIERENFWMSKLATFAKKDFAASLTKYNPHNLKFFSYKHWKNYQIKERLIFDQKVIEERLNILGCDLAAAHFVVYRGGGVKFFNHDWIRFDKEKNDDYDDKLPNTYNPEYIVEGLDLSETKILYEGLKNLENLQSLKWLSFCACPYFDVWCLDRISGICGDNLEYLDISFTNISHEGLGAIYRFNQLKTLRVEGLPDNAEFLNMYVQLMKCFPQLSIEGIPTETVTSEQKL